MTTEVPINVVVQISDELKNLLGYAARPERNTAVLAAPPSPHQETGWQTLCIRRDGERPLRFHGLPVLQRDCEADVPMGRTTQTLSVYLAESGTIYAGLVFEPSGTCPARPAYRCKAINDPAELTQFLRNWRPEDFFETVRPTGRTLPHDPAAGPLAARSAFNSMAADCLNIAVLQG